MEVTERALEAAMREAVAQGLLKKHATPETYIATWAAMRKVLEAAMQEALADCPSCQSWRSGAMLVLDELHPDDNGAAKAPHLRVRAMRVEVEALRNALRAAESILWMAERYAEAGGSHGPEMQDYREVKELVAAALPTSE